MSNNSAKSSPLVVSVNEWNPTQVKFMQPKVNERGGKSINIISGQTNRSLHISTPLLMTWGISDFIDEKTGESDGKFSMTLNFPNEDYSNPSTREFLQKLKEFENQVLDAAVKYSEVWWGEEMSREVAKHTFFPFIKYSKSKETKKIDLSKPPSIRAKVPNYNNKWNVEIYDTKGNLIFPCDNENMTPMDFVPKKSNVACVIQCGGIWITPKAFGVTWKVNQIVVKPNEVQSVFGKCHVQLSDADIKTIESNDVNSEVVNEEEEAVTLPAGTTKSTTEVEDSDAEEEAPAPVAEPEPVKVEEDEPVAVAPVKKIVKKVAAPVAVVEEAAPVAAAPKKIVKKKVAA